MNILILLSCFLLLASIGTTLAFASSSEDDDDDNSQEVNPQNDQQSQVTWKNFKDRNNLFTVQYPSDWAPSAPVEDEISGPIDIIFFAPVTGADEVAQVEFIQYAQPSIFSTPQEALESEISTLQNDPTVTKFEIERPLECQRFTLNSLPACSYIYEITSPDGNLAVMAVDALAPDGTEYEVYYHGSFDLFEDFLPAAESMVKSFRTTGSNASISDFSLGGGGTFGSNITSQQNTTPSGSEDFSLG